MHLNEVIAKRERFKRNGTYKSGMNMDAGGVDGYTEEELMEIRAARKRPRTTNANKECQSCKMKGHATERSSKCLNFKGTKTTGLVCVPVAAAAAMPAEARDYYAYDTLPLQDDPSSDVDLDLLLGTADDDDDDFDDQTGKTGVL
jgi:hypothetical protein